MHVEILRRQNKCADRCTNKCATTREVYHASRQSTVGATNPTSRLDRVRMSPSQSQQHRFKGLGMPRLGSTLWLI